MQQHNKATHQNLKPCLDYYDIGKIGSNYINDGAGLKSAKQISERNLNKKDINSLQNAVAQFPSGPDRSYSQSSQVNRRRNQQQQKFQTEKLVSQPFAKHQLNDQPHRSYQHLAKKQANQLKSSLDVAAPMSTLQSPSQAQRAYLSPSIKKNRSLVAAGITPKQFVQASLKQSITRAPSAGNKGNQKVGFVKIQAKDLPRGKSVGNTRAQQGNSLDTSSFLSEAQSMLTHLQQNSRERLQSNSQGQNQRRYGLTEDTRSVTSETMAGIVGTSSQQTIIESIRPQIIYQCRECSSSLFSDLDLVAHERFAVDEIKASSDFVASERALSDGKSQSTHVKVQSLGRNSSSQLNGKKLQKTLLDLLPQQSSENGEIQTSDRTTTVTTTTTVALRSNQSELDRLSAYERLTRRGAYRCKIYFTAKLDWFFMEHLNQAQGKLLCPENSCRSEIGTFNYNGQRCPTCVQLVAPAFMFQRSKLKGKLVDQQAHRQQNLPQSQAKSNERTDKVSGVCTASLPLNTITEEKSRQRSCDSRIKRSQAKVASVKLKLARAPEKVLNIKKGMTQHYKEGDRCVDLLDPPIIQQQLALTQANRTRHTEHWKKLLKNVPGYGALKSALKGNKTGQKRVRIAEFAPTRIITKSPQKQAEDEEGSPRKMISPGHNKESSPPAVARKPDQFQFKFPVSKSPDTKKSAQSFFPIMIYQDSKKLNLQNSAANNIKMAQTPDVKPQKLMMEKKLRRLVSM